jgi:hypothetical protein
MEIAQSGGPASKNWVLISYPILFDLPALLGSTKRAASFDVIPGSGTRYT